MWELLKVYSSFTVQLIASRYLISYYQEDAKNIRYLSKTHFYTTKFFTKAYFSTQAYLHNGDKQATHNKGTPSLRLAHSLTPTHLPPPHP